MSKLYLFVNVNLFDPLTESQVLGNLRRQIEKTVADFPNYKIVVLASTLWELHSQYDINKTAEFLKSLKKEIGIEYFLLYNKALDQFDFNLHNGIFYNFFLNKLLHSKLAMQQQFADKWNSSNFKFLFLTGKIAKRNRIIPLIKFVDTNLLEHSVYSLRYREDLLEQVDTVAQEYSTKFLKKFMKNYHHLPDSPRFLDLSSTTHYDGVPFDYTLYKQTSLSVISESELSAAEIWLTEKTWRAILNKHPFLFLGQPFTCRYLEEKGFKTFREYWPRNYDDIEDFDERLEAVIEILLWLKDNWHNLDHKSINRDIKHNYRLALQISALDIRNFNQLVNFKSGDLKLHGGLYVNNVDVPKVVDLSRDHLCYYNWANYNTDYFWRNNE